MPGKVLITGATGFVGRAVLHELVGLEGFTIEAAVRPGGRGSRVEGAGSIEVSMRDADATGSAVSRCDYVVHLAFDSGDLPGNEPILRNLAEAALAAGVKRFVHMSSMAIYEPLRAAHLDETAAPGHPETAYAGVKQELERVLDGFVARGLPVTILQPTVVYGPGSRTWVDEPVRSMLRGELALPAGGQGRANLVYVTDVAGSVARALVADVASGERFLISGADIPRWSDYYGWIDRLVGRSSLRLMPADALLAGKAYQLKRIAGRLTDPNGPLIRRLPSPARSPVSALLRRAGLPDRPVFYPPAALAGMYASDCLVDIAKARRLLGYAPQIDVAAGQALLSGYVSALVDRAKLAHGPR